MREKKFIFNFKIQPRGVPRGSAKDKITFSCKILNDMLDVRLLKVED